MIEDEWPAKMKRFVSTLVQDDEGKLTFSKPELVNEAELDFARHGENVVDVFKQTFEKIGDALSSDDYTTYGHVNPADMKADSFYGIHFYVLDSIETANLITTNGGRIDKGYTKLLQRNIFSFPDNRFLYSLPDKSLIFNSENDLLKYRSMCDQLANIKYDEDVNYAGNLRADFIKNIGKYIDSFKVQSKLDLSFDNLEELRKVDNWVNGHTESNMDRFSDELTIVIGEYIRRAIKNGRWFYTSLFDEKIIPLIMDERAVYNPFRIVNRELNYYRPKEGSISFYDHVKIQLIGYAEIKKATDGQ